MAEKFIAYYRVSTRQQGQSGLGLEAQERDVGIFLSQHGGELAEAFTDIQSGKDARRSGLDKALALARMTGYPILVAKLDRLSRSVAFIASLLDDKAVKLTVACMPAADKFQLHIYAALAEQEREFISARTKAGLASAKARGVKLGNPNLRHADITSARDAMEAARANANAFAQRVAPFVHDARAAGANTHYKIARALEARGVKTRTGKERWNETQVSRLMARLDKTEA